MWGIPTPPWRILYSFDSYNSWGCLAFTDSSFTATSWEYLSGYLKVDNTIYLSIRDVDS